MKSKKSTKVVHTKSTRDTKSTRIGLVYASGGWVTHYLLYMPPAAG